MTILHYASILEHIKVSNMTILHYASIINHIKVSLTMTILHYASILNHIKVSNNDKSGSTLMFVRSFRR